MLTHKRIAVTSLVVIIVLASLMLIPSVKATIIAEMPPYEDKWTLAGGSNDPDAYADVSSGNLQVFMFPFTGEGASAHAKVWKRVWLPAADLEISCSWKLKGYLMCGLYLSWTGADLCLFVEESLNSGTIHETNLFHRYVDMVLEYQESVDEPWQSPPPIVVSIPEAGYYNVGAGLHGRAGGLLASCAFVGEEEGGWVSMSISVAAEPVNLVVYVAVPTCAYVWVDGDPYLAPIDIMVTQGQHTLEVAKSLLVEEWIPGQYYIYVFHHWSDGSKDNPRTITLTSDKTLTAHYLRREWGILNVQL